MQRSQAKERLRKKTLELRREMSFEDVFEKSSAAQKRFIESSFFRACLKKRPGPCKIALYSSFQNEVLTDAIFEKAVQKGIEVCFPRAVRTQRRLAFFKVSSITELSPGSYDILEPANGEEEAPAQSLGLIIVPGVAFDANGTRLGYGKGYYDRALSEVKCPIVALAYDFQVLREGLPAEPHDIPVQAVITEKRVIKAGMEALTDC